MNRVKPEYFDDIWARASEAWDIYDKRPDLAGPAKVLFRQVKASPVLVLSELLQNADDAKANSAAAYINDGTLYFEHDGLDFTSMDFKSLCSFGSGVRSFNPF